MERQVAVYQGDEMVCLGTVEECAEELGVRPKTIRYYLTPTYQRRYDAYKRPVNRPGFDGESVAGCDEGVRVALGRVISGFERDWLSVSQA